MTTRHNTKQRIPPPTPPFRFSRAALGLLLATLILALLIGFSTYRNINRSRGMIEEFLAQKGETVIRSLEAGNRTAMMHHHMGSGDPLHTLIQESIRENDIAFITLMDKSGQLLDKTGDIPFQLSQQDIDSIITTGGSITTIMAKDDLFTVSRLFVPQKHFPPMDGWPQRMMMGRMTDKPDDKIISVGLVTKEFDAARKQDMQHALFMGAILFLVGSAGLYVLFLYQEMRITRSTLADLKIYTDNVIESIPAGLITLDSEHRVISCNKKMEELFGDKFHDILGKPVSQAFPGCDIDCATLHNDALEYAAECRGSEGRLIPVKILGSPLVNDEGEQTGTVLIIRDMTVIKEMEQQLERSRHMAALGKMAAGIAHEIRNPLGTLRGFAHYFGTLPEIAEEGKGYAELMKSEVDRLNRTISGLLQFARPREPQITSVKLDELFRKTAALTDGDFAKQQLTFRCPDTTNIEISADPDQLLQVLMNLLQNSVMATPPGGDISLRATDDGDFVRITVADSGSGMNVEEQEKMFDPFYTTRSNGTGLGLAVSHQIIEQHNGSFEVQSTPGEGTAITIVLPRHRGRQ